MKIKTSSDILEDRHRMGKCENFERNHNIFLRVFYYNECNDNLLTQDLGRRAQSIFESFQEKIPI